MQPFEHQDPKDTRKVIEFGSHAFPHYTTPDLELSRKFEKEIRKTHLDCPANDNGIHNPRSIVPGPGRYDFRCLHCLTVFSFDEYRAKQLAKDN